MDDSRLSTATQIYEKDDMRDMCLGVWFWWKGWRSDGCFISSSRIKLIPRCCGPWLKSRSQDASTSTRKRNPKFNFALSPKPPAPHIKTKWRHLKYLFRSSERVNIQPAVRQPSNSGDFPPAGLIIWGLAAASDRRPAAAINSLFSKLNRPTFDTTQSGLLGGWVNLGSEMLATLTREV